MKKIILVSLLLVSSAALSGQSFRLADGDLVYTGMTKIEVLEKLGAPMMKDVQSVGINKGDQQQGKKIEVWSYKVDGSIGGEYLVSVTFKGDKATDINSIQKNR